MATHYDLQIPGAHIMPSHKKCKICGQMFKFYQNTFINYGGRGLVLEDLCDNCIQNKVNEGQEKEKLLREKIMKLHTENRANIKQMVDEQYNKTAQKNNEFSEF